MKSQLRSRAFPTSPALLQSLHVGSTHDTVKPREASVTQLPRISWTIPFVKKHRCSNATGK